MTGDDALPPVCGSGKRSYLTRREAAAHAKRVRRDGGHLRPYRCPRKACRFWHVGHVPDAVIRGETTADEFYDNPWRVQ